MIISGDSDFSALVSKLRENAKIVIGVGVKSSTSDLLISNCDEFIFYDDLVVKCERSPRRRRGEAGTKVEPQQNQVLRMGPEDRAQEAIFLVRETVEAIYAERGDRAKRWGSMVKQALKRRQPSFNESFYGFASFNELLEKAQARGQLELEMDKRSGRYVVRSVTQPSLSESCRGAALNVM